jgi:acetyl-CoA carboxylase biotin carboxyl carrier protein
MTMNLKELKKIISIFQKAKISELEVESEGVRVKLKKEARGKKITPKELSFEIDQVKSLEHKRSQETKEGLHEIVSPMIGTFYIAPSPDSPPFVEVGQEVKEDDTVCIIEAMKIMNEIKAEVNGRIVKVLVEDGGPVEFGQPLFLVEPISEG